MGDATRVVLDGPQRILEQLAPDELGWSAPDSQTRAVPSSSFNFPDSHIFSTVFTGIKPGDDC